MLKMLTILTCLRREATLFQYFYKSFLFQAKNTHTVYSLAPAREIKPNTKLRSLFLVDHRNQTPPAGELSTKWKPTWDSQSKVYEYVVKTTKPQRSKADPNSGAGEKRIAVPKIMKITLSMPMSQRNYAKEVAMDNQSWANENE